jgi:glycerol-3-phosphate O-acyltransferase
LQTYERYYVTVAVLAKNGSGTLTRGELERLCTLTAQRISQLNEFAAPDFYDKTLLRQFIELLRSSGILSVNEDGKYEFTELIAQIADDAKLVLSKDIRHGIIRVAPQLLELSEEDARGEREPGDSQADDSGELEQAGELRRPDPE